MEILSHPYPHILNTIEPPPSTPSFNRSEMEILSHPCPHILNTIEAPPPHLTVFTTPMTPFPHCELLPLFMTNSPF